MSLRVAVKGRGQPLLLLSGIGASIEMWRPFESLIRGSTTISLDLPGVGQSPRTGAPVRMRRLASIVAAALDELGFPRVDVLGYSFGGAVAQQLAHDWLTGDSSVRSPAQSTLDPRAAVPRLTCSLSEGVWWLVPIN